MKKIESKLIEKKIISWFKKKKKKISSKQDFFNENILDSFDLIDFVVFLEKEFSIKFDPEDFSNQSFPIIKDLAKIIKKKINGL